MSGTVRATRLDALFAVVTVLGVLAVTALTGGTVEGPEAATLPLAVALGVLALYSRRRPVLVLTLCLTLLVGFRTAGLTGTGWLWPATLAYVGAVLAGRLGWAVGLATLHALAAYNVAWAVHGGPAVETLVRVGLEALRLALAVAVADAYRNWRRWQDEVVDRLRREALERDAAARERQAAAVRRQAEERLRIARELHDVVAHTLAVVGVHLNVAADALDHAPEEARDALRLAQRVRGTAMSDLGSLVRLLRADAPAVLLTPPSDGLGDVDEVVEQTRATGLDVRLVEHGDRGAVPTAVALAVSRIVREALTNTIRHAGATAVTVTLHCGPPAVEVSVVDDGTGGGHRADGSGLTGMAERVAAFHGTFTAGPVAAGGFAVRATIPS